MFEYLVVYQPNPGFCCFLSCFPHYAYTRVGADVVGSSHSGSRQ